MVPLTSLLVPVLLSAVLVFLASSVLHMMTRWHRNDVRKVGDEDGVVAALRRSTACSTACSRLERSAGCGHSRARRISDH